MIDIKKVAAVHDIAGYGRASLTVVIPVLASMGVQVCPMPTAVFSNQTEYENFSKVDLTDSLPQFIARWEELGLTFDSIYTGFLGSIGQIDIIKDFITRFRNEKCRVLVDPVMGDEGSIYPVFSQEYTERMKSLVSTAHIITPNLTEACLLLGIPYPDRAEDDFIKESLVRLSDLGPQKVVITGIPHPREDKLSVACFDKACGRRWKITGRKYNAGYSGTGDAFASALLGGLLKGDSLPAACDRAMKFVSACIRDTYEYKDLKEFLLEGQLPFLNSYLPGGNYTEI